MMYMNDYEIERAVRRYEGHPVLGKATAFLLAFMHEVNAHSDGWAYWRPPVESAKKLMMLIQSPDTASEAALKKAIAPIKAFYTRRGYAAKMEWPKGILEPLPTKRFRILYNTRNSDTDRLLVEDTFEIEATELNVRSMAGKFLNEAIDLTGAYGTIVKVEELTRP
jgi:hypothetical protein